MFIYRKLSITIRNEGIVKWSKLVVTLIASICITVYAQEPLQLESAKEINTRRSRLIQLTRSLESADIQQQYEFVQIALIEMHHAYQSEIKKSLNTHPATTKKQQKLIHWRYATQVFIDQLDQYFMLLDSDVHFSLRASRQQKVLLVIGGHPVIVNGPNPSSHKLMEQNIVQQFCQFYDCSYYFDNSTLSAYLTKDGYHDGFDDEIVFNSTTNISGSWLFSSEYNPIYKTGQGVNCEFINSTERKKKETACQSLVDEASRLSEALQDARDAGNRIEHEHLSIKPLSDINMVQIIINKQGYHIKLSLPLLQKNPELFSDIQPWLEVNSETTLENIIITGADRLLN